MSFPITWVKALAKANRIHVSAHAFDRMGERMIPLDDVMQAIEYGEVIEIQDGHWHLMLRYCSKRQPRINLNFMSL